MRSTISPSLRSRQWVCMLLIKRKSRHTYIKSNMNDGKNKQPNSKFLPYNKVGISNHWSPHIHKLFERERFASVLWRWFKCTKSDFFFIHNKTCFTTIQFCHKIYTFWPNTKIKRIEMEKAPALCMSVLCVLFFAYSHELLTLFIYIRICNMIIDYIFIFGFLLPFHRELVSMSVCVSVYLVWKIALNFHKGFPSYFMLKLLFVRFFAFRNVHIAHTQKRRRREKEKPTTGNQKRINTKIKMYHRFVHVLLAYENKLEYSLRRQFVCIRRVCLFVVGAFFYLALAFIFISLYSLYALVRV